MFKHTFSLFEQPITNEKMCEEIEKILFTKYGIDIVVESKNNLHYIKVVQLHQENSFIEEKVLKEIISNDSLLNNYKYIYSLFN